MKFRSLRVLAGRVALARLRERGLSLGDVEVFVAPAGGTKFLLLGGLDQVLFPALRGRKTRTVLHGVGGSVGSWRLTALAARNPSAALERLATAYIEERRYGADAPAVTHYCHVMDNLVSELVGDEAQDALADPSWLRLHVLATRCIGLAASDRRGALLAGLGLAAGGSVFGRRALAWQFERVVFHSRGQPGPLAELADVPTRHARLAGDNLVAVLRASAAIPLLVRGVVVPGAPPGIYRDAALLDHHPILNLEISDDGLVLYPHWYSHLRPSFFDRPLPSRALVGSRALDRTVLLTPSAEFVERLPGGRRPSRRDARRLSPAERMVTWRRIWSAGAELGDALGELLERPRLVADVVEPLGAR